MVVKRFLWSLKKRVCTTAYLVSACSCTLPSSLNNHGKGMLWTHPSCDWIWHHWTLPGRIHAPIHCTCHIVLPCMVLWNLCHSSHICCYSSCILKLYKTILYASFVTKQKHSLQSSCFMTKYYCGRCHSFCSPADGCWRNEKGGKVPYKFRVYFLVWVVLMS